MRHHLPRRQARLRVAAEIRALRRLHQKGQVGAVRAVSRQRASAKEKARAPRAEITGHLHEVEIDGRSRSTGGPRERFWKRTSSTTGQTPTIKLQSSKHEERGRRSSGGVASGPAIAEDLRGASARREDRGLRGRHSIQSMPIPTNPENDRPHFWYPRDLTETPARIEARGHRVLERVCAQAQSLFRGVFHHHRPAWLARAGGRARSCCYFWLPIPGSEHVQARIPSTGQPRRSRRPVLALRRSCLDLRLPDFLPPLTAHERYPRIHDTEVSTGAEPAHKPTHDQAPRGFTSGSAGSSIVVTAFTVWLSYVDFDKSRKGEYHRRDDRGHVQGRLGRRDLHALERGEVDDLEVPALHRVLLLRLVSSHASSHWPIRFSAPRTTHH